MAGLGAGYDLSVSTISPDGRVFQVEYAAKAVDQGCTVVGAVCRDGIVLAVQRPALSPAAVPGTSKRLFAVDRHCVVAAAGFAADAMEIVARARLEAREYRRVFGRGIPGRVIAERIAYFVHIYTLAGSERPFGAAILLAVSNEGARTAAANKGTATGATTTCIADVEMEGNREPESEANVSTSHNPPPLPAAKKSDLTGAVPKFDVLPSAELYAIDNAGVCYRYFGVALGRGKQAAKTALERLPLTQLTSRQCLKPLAKITLQAHDESRLREEVEAGSLIDMAWICEESNWNHQPVPFDLLSASEQEARRHLEEDETGDDAGDNTDNGSSHQIAADANMADATSVTTSS